MKEPKFTFDKAEFIVLDESGVPEEKDVSKWSTQVLNFIDKNLTEKNNTSATNNNETENSNKADSNNENNNKDSNNKKINESSETNANTEVSKAEVADVNKKSPHIEIDKNKLHEFYESFINILSNKQLPIDNEDQISNFGNDLLQNLGKKTLKMQIENYNGHYS